MRPPSLFFPTGGGGGAARRIKAATGCQQQLIDAWMDVGTAGVSGHGVGGGRVVGWWVAIMDSRTN